MKTKSLKNRLKAVFVAFVSVLLCMGTLAMPAFAEEVSTGNVPQGGTPSDYVLSQTDAKIFKTYDWAKGAAAPAQTFSFKVTATTNSPTGTPAIADRTIALSSTNVIEGTDGMVTATGATQIIPDGTSFPHAGLYYYKVTEIPGTTTGVQYNTDNSTYTVTVNVINGTNGTEVSEITIVKNGVKYQSAAFMNRYTELAGDLAISKTVTGESGDLTLAFPYTITFTASPAETAPYTVNYTNTDGTYGSFVLDATKTTSATVAGKTYTMTFNLTNGQNIVFTGAKAGTTYKVTELLSNNATFEEYTPSVLVKDNIASTATGTTTSKTKGADLDASGTLGSQINSADYTNNRTPITITGIFTDNLPYILLVVGIIGAGAVYYTMRRRQAA